MAFWLLAVILSATWPAVWAQSLYTVDASQLGVPFHSVGAQSTAGTSRLLYDYPEPQRAQILDLLFSPQYGASFQHLKVEIGGDSQISCGAEASAIRSADGSDTDFNRGYEHWLMAEAKKRNPEIVLLGLVYAFPGWVNPNGTSPYDSPATEQNAADYVTEWVGGLKRFHNLSVDWVGLWNEQSYTLDYVRTLRETLDRSGLQDVSIAASDRLWEPIGSDFLASAALRTEVAALTAHYPHCDARQGNSTGQSCAANNSNAKEAHRKFGVPLWSSEDYSCWTDALGASAWGSAVNSNYIGGNISMHSAWHLVSAFYPTVAFWNEGMLSAAEPWSGHYVASPTLWASAHTTQFSFKGMQYLLQGYGAGALDGGGSFVSLVGGGHLTVVIETAGAAIQGFSDHNCNGKIQYRPAVAAQNATFKLVNFSTHSLVLWRSRFGEGVTEATLFERVGEVPVASGAIQVLLEPDSIYTLSTLQTATKAGGSLPAIPPPAAFPLPYQDDFEGSSLSGVGRYWADMEGAFQVSVSSDGTGARVLRQASRKACCNFIGSLDGPIPLTILGSSLWENIAASVALRPGDGFGVLGLRAKFKTNSFFSAGLGSPGGLFLAVNHSGWRLGLSLGSISGAGWGACRLPSCLVDGSLGGHPPEWIRISLTVSNRSVWYQVGTVRGSLVLPEGSASGGGFVALGAGYTGVEFDNFTVDQAPGVPVSRCSRHPGPGARLVALGCGEAAALGGSSWLVSGGDGGEGPISLRADPSLCLAPTWNWLRGIGHVELVVCSPGNASLLWRYSSSAGGIVHVESTLGLSWNSSLDLGDFGAVTLSTSGSGLWWSPDAATGYIHGNSNQPLACPCLGVCGQT